MAQSNEPTGLDLASPLYVKNRDIQRGNNNDKIYSYDICAAATKVVNDRYIQGAQLVKGVWKLYVNGLDSKLELLNKGIVVKNISVTVHETDPYSQTRNQLPVERILIKDLPMEIPNETVKKFLNEQTGIVLKSDVKFNRIKDHHGKLTNFYDGDRFVYALSPILLLKGIM